MYLTFWAVVGLALLSCAFLICFVLVNIPNFQQEAQQAFSASQISLSGNEAKLSIEYVIGLPLPESAANLHYANVYDPIAGGGESEAWIKFETNENGLKKLLSTPSNLCFSLALEEKSKLNLPSRLQAFISEVNDSKDLNSDIIYRTQECEQSGNTQNIVVEILPDKVVVYIYVGRW